uniref:Uncharacterized protein n=2 Tax=Bradyrhizobium TaxID=374 RepID=A0A2U8PWI1_9BRAD|nr:hypothetical protein CIT40_20480 [Bradyrhizobium amphicarpaeae]
MYIRSRTLRLGVPRSPPRGSRRSEIPLGSKVASERARAVDEWRYKKMTTEIINLTGTIGHWLNLLVARQIAAQAAKLPH